MIIEKIRWCQRSPGCGLVVLQQICNFSFRGSSDTPEQEPAECAEQPCCGRWNYLGAIYFEKCPCRQAERRFSETQCSQVVSKASTWEQYVPDNRPYRPLQGRFRKTHRSQVFRPALSAFPPTTFGIVTNLKYRNHRDASEHNAERRLSLRVETAAGDETIPDCGT